MHICLSEDIIGSANDMWTDRHQAITRTSADWFYKKFTYSFGIVPFHKDFYASAFSAGGIMFSGCPSVHLSVRPSVRLERFPGICRRTHGGNGLKFCMVMYLDHLQNWIDYGHGLLIFLLLTPLWLSETGQIGGFRAFPGERMEGMGWHFAWWCILTTFRTD